MGPANRLDWRALSSRRNAAAQRRRARPAQESPSDGHLRTACLTATPCDIGNGLPSFGVREGTRGPRGDRGAAVVPGASRRGAEGVEDGKTAVREHNDIRHAVRAVADHQHGSDRWWEAVRHAQQVNGDHMADEEQNFIPPFKDAVEAARRDEMGMEWLKLHDEHDGARDLSGEDADPQAVVESNVS